MARSWHLRERTQQGNSKTQTATSNSNKRQQGTQRRRGPTAAEQGIVGLKFEDDAIEWVVLKVEWDDSVDEIVVYYYDKQAMEAIGVDVDMLDDGSDEIERSSVAEVKQWIAESNRKGR